MSTITPGNPEATSLLKMNDAVRGGKRREKGLVPLPRNNPSTCEDENPKDPEQK
jgi:hypothetical protein